MKVCNNCSTVNDDAVDKCGHCNMSGNFTYQGATQSVTVAQKASIDCKNCGSEDPGEGAKCVHCHFPLPIPASAGNRSEYQGTDQLEEFPKLTTKANLRVG